MSQVTRIGVERELRARRRARPSEPAPRARRARGGRRRRRFASTDPTRPRSARSPRAATPVELERIHPVGLFEGTVRGATAPLRYRLEVEYPNGSTFELDDPYRFLPTLGELDLHLAGEGRHEELYAKLGAHLREMDGTAGAAFAVWAPAARSVSVVGDFNGWDGRLHPMRTLGRVGIWELFVPGLEPGTNYKFEIRAQNGGLLLKVDPYAFATEVPPKNASVVFRPEHDWGDADWLARRAAGDLWRGPVSIYEVHLGSWRLNPLEGNRSLTYLELADELADYVLDLGFTHVELMPVMEHPFTGSWGYQVTGYYAPTSRFGSPDDFRVFVDRLHQRGLGVVLDWVPAHFPRDEWALARFDGTALYEHQDPRRGAHPDWGTLVFNYGRNEVRNFLLANALFWLREYHADGLRVDAVASMLYLDYSRKAGEWIPNAYGGREDLDAIAFLQELNAVVARRRAGRADGGRGVDRLAGRDAADRHRRARLRLQVEHGLDARHARLLPPRAGAPAAPSQPALVRADLRLHGELHPSALPRRGRPRQGLAPARRCRATAGSSSRTCARCTGTCGRIRARSSCSWAASWRRSRSGATSARSTGTCSSGADHGGVQALVRDLNRIYRDEPALWEADYEPTGFRWLEADDASWNVLAFARFSGDGSRCLVSAGNFSPVPRHRYRIGLPRGGRWREVLNTDAAGYGGSNVVNGTRLGRGDALARPALLGRGDAPAARRPLARARKVKPGRVLASSYKRLSGTLERHDPLMARNHDSGRN